jgi:methyltransferase (TIGR00027 family)
MADIHGVRGTAFVIAAFRVEEGESSEPLYYDDVAKMYLNREALAQADEMVRPSPFVKEMVKLRTAYFDAALGAAVTRGYHQILILGSGLDTRSIRLRRQGVRFFEVDDPATLDFKAEVLRRNGLCPEAVYIPADYVRDDHLAALSGRGFRPDEPTFVLWEGNVTLLTRAEVVAVAGGLRTGLKRLRLALDYMAEKIIRRTTGCPDMDPFIDRYQSSFAAWKTGYDDVTALAGDLGMSIIEHRSVAQLHRSHRPGRPLESDLLNFYFVCTARN